MSILIGGDLVPTSSNSKLFESGDVQNLFGKGLVELFQKVDYRICNLETPLCDQKSPIPKYGPNLIASQSSIKGIKEININLVTLANNHIMDQGVQGLNTTRRVLKDSGINFVGVGDNLSKAAIPFIFEQRNRRFGVYVCAEHEFSIAQKDMPGANPFDPLESFDHVADLRKHCDYVIVLYHGGKEYYRYPSPWLQRVCRKFVDKGANLVLCQHSHCIGCSETYKNGTVLYGQGNFLFDIGTNDFLNTSLLVLINDDLSVSFIPLLKNNVGVRLASQEESGVVLQQLCRRNEEIKNPDFIEKQYNEFANSMRLRYLTVFAGKKSFIFKAINKVLGKNRLQKIFSERAYDQYACLPLLNYLRCEAHRECAIRFLNEYLRKKLS